MKQSRYRLLIVESAVLARGLRELNIPGLEVLSTGGYAWLPEMKTGSGGRLELRARANPEPPQLAFRRELRSKAGLAADIIIATDADPSGAFIASCISKFLKHDARLRRGYLTQLSAAAVQQLLDTAAPMSNAAAPDTNADFLRRYFLMRQRLRTNSLRKLNQLGYALPPECDVIALLLAIDRLQAEKAQHFIVYGDGFQAYVQSLESVQLCDSMMKLSPVSSVQKPVYPPPEQPLSTAFLGEFDPADLKIDSYDALQHQLNLLFSVKTDTGAAPVSYPRTASRAWTCETWDQLSPALMRADNCGAEKLRPAFMRRLHTPEAGTGHQALHITSFRNTPHQMRRFLKPPALALYSRVYESTRNALSYPDALPPGSLLQDKTGNRYLTKDDQLTRALQAERLTFEPIIPLSDLLQSLLDSGWVKASSLGRTADALCAHPWLSFYTQPLPHLRLNNIPDGVLKLSLEVRQEAGAKPEVEHHH